MTTGGPRPRVVEGGAGDVTQRSGILGDGLESPEVVDVVGRRDVPESGDRCRPDRRVLPAVGGQVEEPPDGPAAGNEPQRLDEPRAAPGVGCRQERPPDAAADAGGRPFRPGLEGALGEHPRESSSGDLGAQGVHRGGRGWAATQCPGGVVAKVCAVVVEKADQPRLAGRVAQRAEAVHGGDGDDLVGRVSERPGQPGHRLAAGARGGGAQGVHLAERLDDGVGLPDGIQGAREPAVVAGRHVAPAVPGEAGGPGWWWAAHGATIGSGAHFVQTFDTTSWPPTFAPGPPSSVLPSPRHVVNHDRWCCV